MRSVLTKAQRDFDDSLRVQEPFSPLQFQYHVEGVMIQKNRAYVVIVSNHSHTLGRPYLAKILRHNGTLFDIHSEAFRAICPTKIKAITRVMEWMKTNRDHDIKQFYGGEWH